MQLRRLGPNTVDLDKANKKCCRKTNFLPNDQYIQFLDDRTVNNSNTAGGMVSKVGMRTCDATLQRYSRESLQPFKIVQQSREPQGRLLLIRSEQSALLRNSCRTRMFGMVLLEIMSPVKERHKSILGHLRATNTKNTSKYENKHQEMNFCRGVPVQIYAEYLS